MDSKERQELDRHITGNYGEDQFPHPEDAVPDYENFEREQLAQDLDAERAEQEREQQAAEWQAVVRFRHDPETELMAALLKSGKANITVPPDTLLGHLGNALQVLEAAILFAEPRVDDGDLPTSWATMRLEEAVRMTSRLRAVRNTLRETFERQGMLDTSSRADNLPI